MRARTQPADRLHGAHDSSVEAHTARVDARCGQRQRTVPLRGASAHRDVGDLDVRASTGGGDGAAHEADRERVSEGRIDVADRTELGADPVDAARTVTVGPQVCAGEGGAQRPERDEQRRLERT